MEAGAVRQQQGGGLQCFALAQPAQEHAVTPGGQRSGIKMKPLFRSLESPACHADVQAGYRAPGQNPSAKAPRPAAGGPLGEGKNQTRRLQCTDSRQQKG
jgi:hypothetical protein